MLILIYDAYLCGCILFHLLVINRYFVLTGSLSSVDVYRYFSSVLSMGRSDRIDTKETRGKWNYK